MSITLRTSSWTICVGCVLALAYFFYAHFSFSSTQLGSAHPAVPDELAPAPGFAAATSTELSAANNAPRTAPRGSLEYRNSTYHVSLFYPNNLKVKAYDEGNGAATITFQDVATAEGFQMFVVPYTSTQVSKARFMIDEPTGVMQSPLFVTVGGVPATSFYSTNQILRDTNEMWFIRDGYLYELTAPKPLAAWLSQIVQSWQFI